MLMVERNSAGMFGSLVVFPGGVTDESDDDLRHTAFRELHEETGIAVDQPDSLVLVSRWVTPSKAPQRFDTSFFLLEVGPETEASVDGVELIGASWATPEEALARAGSGTWSMILPTVAHLRWLSRRESIGDAFAAARGADGQTVIEPTVLDDGTLLPLHRAADQP